MNPDLLKKSPYLTNASTGVHYGYRVTGLAIGDDCKIIAGDINPRNQKWRISWLSTGKIIAMPDFYDSADNALEAVRDKMAASSH